MNAPPPIHADGGDHDSGASFIYEDDIVDVYDVDDEDLPDANDGDREEDNEEEEGEEISDGVDDSVHVFSGHTDELYAVVCSPVDPTLVATGGKDDKGFLWKINTGAWAFELQGHAETVFVLSFSADGKLLASGSLNGVVKVWDIAHGAALICTLQGPPEGIEWLRWHPTEYMILAGSEDSLIWMWDLGIEAVLTVFAGHGSSVTCGDFTPNGQTICSGSSDSTMIIWNPGTGEKTVISGHLYHTEGLTCLAITSDSSLALTGAVDGSLHLVNISTGMAVASLNAHSDSVECAAFEASSSQHFWRAATGGIDNKLFIWDSDNSDPRCTCDHEEEVTCLLWLSSIYIATGCGDGKVRIWNSLSGMCVRIYSGHSGSIQSMASSCNGDFLVSASLDGKARVFEIQEFRDV